MLEDATVSIDSMRVMLVWILLLLLLAFFCEPSSAIAANIIRSCDLRDSVPFVNGIPVQVTD